MIEHSLKALRPLLPGVGFGIATAADFQQLPLYPEEAQHARNLWPAGNAISGWGAAPRAEPWRTWG